MAQIQPTDDEKAIMEVQERVFGHHQALARVSH